MPRRKKVEEVPAKETKKRGRKPLPKVEKPKRPRGRPRKFITEP